MQINDEMPPAVQAEVIRKHLAGHTGTESWTRHSLNRNLLLTDGAIDFAEIVGGYWFLDIVATELYPLLEREPFLCVRLLVADDKTAVIATDDGNGNVVHQRAIEWTDCPPGEWKFFLTDSVFMLPSEY